MWFSVSSPHRPPRQDMKRRTAMTERDTEPMARSEKRELRMRERDKARLRWLRIFSHMNDSRRSHTIRVDLGAIVASEGMSKMADEAILGADDRRILDDVQLNRIESMHRGFLYQHLYAVGCLLNLMSVQDGMVGVERHEDIEIISDNSINFIQVKTRSRPIRYSDLERTLKRFSDLRDRHTSSPAIAPRFAIVSNAEASDDLGKRIRSIHWPGDVVFSSPRHKASVHPLAPSPWPSVEDALHWCIAIASQFAFQSLPPETLVWKLAARVQFAASGDDTIRRDHRFRRADLPELFEFVVQQLQEFPSVPNDYRSQPGEPHFPTDRNVQLITGFSGGGRRSGVHGKRNMFLRKSPISMLGTCLGPH